MSRTPEEALTVALFHFDAVAEYVAEDVTRQMAIDAIALRLASGIEAMSKLDRTYLEDLFGEWHAMRGMRNLIAHGYIVTDSALVLESAVHELPSIVKVVRGELDKIAESPVDMQGEEA